MNTGLLVEANPYSFAKLMTRRPGSYRIETALCERVSTLRFALPDKQRTADGCCGKASNEGNYAARCTPVSEILRGCGVTHIDFWSLECAPPAPSPPPWSLDFWSLEPLEP